jgi:membrane protease YdiL (CAAX protease family)
MIISITKYFNKSEKYSTGRFILEMTALTYLIKLVFVIIAFILILIGVNESFLLGNAEEKTSPFDDTSWLEGFIWVVVIAPPLETLTSQAVPIYLLSIITKKRITIVLVSSVIFAFMHSSEPLFVILMIFLTAIIYAFSFLVYKSKGFMKAFAVTTSIHILFNFGAFLSYYL